MASVAKHMRALRNKRKLTQEELAEKLFVTRQTVSNWETAKSQPDVETLEKIAAALDTDLMTLIYGARPDERERQLQHKWVRICALCCGVMLAVFTLLWGLDKTGTLGTWREGINYQFWNKMYNIEYGDLSGTYTVELDLYDLESNVGKVLYEEDGCRIVVDWMDETMTPGCYRVFFRAHGNVAPGGSRLVSGVQTDMVDKNVWTFDDSAEMTVTVGNVETRCSFAGSTGLSWKDGNQFGFYIELESNLPGRPSLTEAVAATDGKVTASVSGLTWMETNRLQY